MILSSALQNILELPRHNMKKQIDSFLQTLSCSPKTVSTYQNALKQFAKVVGDNPDLTVATYIMFLESIQNKSSSTQRVYTTAVRKFYRFWKSKDLIEIQQATDKYKGKSTKSTAKFNIEAVEKVIAYCQTLRECDADSPRAKLEALRDRAFVLTLVDTGLRISEACSLKRGDVVWDKQYTGIGKGDKYSVVRFSNRSIAALIEYLNAVSYLNQNSQNWQDSQPLFARHDIRASKRIRPITPGGMWKAIKERIIEAGLDRSDVRIHDFRHYFITTAYLASRDIKLSQELARHSTISMTNRYIQIDSEIDAAYKEIFNKN